MPIWDKETGMEMMRYGVLWYVESAKSWVGGGQLIRYRIVRRRGNTFHYDGKLQTAKKRFEVTVVAGDFLYRDHATRTWEKLNIMSLAEAEAYETEKTRNSNDKMAAMETGHEKEGATPHLL